jgi:hypothetical protein
VTAQLTDGDKARVEIDPALNGQVVERERSRTAFAAATRAAETLAKDLSEAGGAAAEAASTVDRLIASVLTFSAETIAVEHERLLAEASTVRETLLAFDQFAAGKHVSLTPKVRAVLGANMQEFARRHDQSQWRAAAAQLRADPLATISVGES